MQSRNVEDGTIDFPLFLLSAAATRKGPRPRRLARMRPRTRTRSLEGLAPFCPTRLSSSSPPPTRENKTDILSHEGKEKGVEADSGGNILSLSRFSVRCGVHWLVTKPMFDVFVMLVIMLSSVALAAEDPVHEKSSRNRMLHKFDYGFTAIFAIECLLKVRARARSCARTLWGRSRPRTLVRACRRREATWPRRTSSSFKGGGRPPFSGKGDFART